MEKSEKLNILFGIWVDCACGTCHPLRGSWCFTAGRRLALGWGVGEKAASSSLVPIASPGAQLQEMYEAQQHSECVQLTNNEITNMGLQ